METCANNELRRQLTKLLEDIRQEGRSATEDFHQLYDIISELFSNGHSASIEMKDSP